MASGRISPIRPSIRLSPSHSRDNSRSTSPERNPGSLYPKIDPLLSNLSPESTLNALTSTEAVPSNGNFSHDVLSQSISQVTPGERALGIRAAIAAQNLHAWYREVQSWTWPSQKDASEGKGFVPPENSQLGVSASRTSLSPNIDDAEFYGSLPAAVVEQYERRIDEIRDGMDSLNVEELKEHVLNAHIPSRSRPSSAASIASMPPPLSYVQLSDFTAVVTATILRALPYLSRLLAFLTTWDVRLFVLRQVPGLLRELKAVRTFLSAALDALRNAEPSIENPDPLSASKLDNERIKLEAAVVEVGRRMDRALDALEGRQDSLPEKWIDDLEGIESDFAAWSMEAERYKLRVEWFIVQKKAMEVEESEHIEPQPEQEELVETHEDETPTQVEPQDLSAAEATEAQPQVQAEVVPTVEEPQAKLDTPRVEVSHVETDEPSIESEASIPATQVLDREVKNAAEDPLPSVEDSQADAKTPQQEVETFTNDEVDDSEAVGHDSLISTDSDSIFPEASDPDTSLSPRDRETMNAELKKSEKDEGPQSPESVVAESIQTPTQKRFPREVSVNASATPSPSRIPLPVTPKVSNKENIRPRDISPRMTPQPLSIVKSIEKDPFTQTPIGKPEPLKPPISSIVDTPAADIDTRDTIETQKGNTDSTRQASPTISSAQQIGDNETSTSTAAQHEDAPTRAIRSDRATSSELKTAPSHENVAAIPPAKTPTSGKFACKTPTEKAAKRVEYFERDIPRSTSPPFVSQVIEEQPAKPKPSKKKPLQSPIKLSKSRPSRLSLDKKSPKSHSRRPSNASVNSMSDNSTLASGPDDPAPLTGSSNEASLAPARPEFSQPDYKSSRNKHVLREDRLRKLEVRKLPTRAVLNDNRSVSLPLERFINEKLDLDLKPDQVPAVPHLGSSRAPVPAKSSRPNSSTPTPQAPFIPKRRHGLTRGKSSNNLRDSDTVSVSSSYDVNRPTFGQNTARRALQHHEQPKSVRLQKRLTAHRSLESLGLKKQELEYVEEDESELLDGDSRGSSPSKKRRRDHLDEKIDSILSTLPGRIHLVDPNNEADTSSSSSSMDRKMRDRYLSESPRGPQSRSITPAPSLTLMPAARRRVSHAHKTEDSYVKLYHLHHGGQTAPTKLFVRTVGEDGQRVMVRVGGGWADLGEYLREYVIHHGRRKVSETPLVEVQGLAPRSSPGYPSPATLFSPPPSTHISGRATPSRPPSALSARPPSSLTVRKTRRGSNASEIVAPRSVTTGTLQYHTSPPATIPTTRRLSISSSYSFNDPHTPGHPSTGPHEARSTPLGLAGPKPRSRQISMSPEGEAWVENVLQKTRRSTSLNPPPFALDVSPGNEGVEEHDEHDPDHEDNADDHQSLSKSRSISDMGSAGASRRVVLRGLGSHR